MRCHLAARIHAAVAVRHAGEIDRGHLQDEARGVEALAIGEGLEHVNLRVRPHDVPALAEDGDDLRFREAVEELAHPDGVEPAGETDLGIAQVGREKLDAAVAAHVLARQLELPGQVHDGDVDVGIVAQTLEGELAGVAADVQQARGRLLEHDGQDRLKAVVRIEVVEGQPAPADVLRQPRQSLVDGGPAAELLQPLRPAACDRSLQAIQPAVTDVVDEVEVHRGHRIVQHEVTSARQRESVVLLWISPARAPPSTRTRRRVFADVHPLLELVEGDAARCQRGFNSPQDAQVPQRQGHLEDDRGEGDELSFFLRLKRRQALPVQKRLAWYHWWVAPGPARPAVRCSYLWRGSWQPELVS